MSVFEDRRALLLALDREWRLAVLRRSLLIRATAERLGIGASDAECLEAVHADGPLTPGRIASVLGLTTGAVTAVVDRLEAAGYVRRERDPTDRRKVLVRTSPARARRLDALREDVLAAWAEALAGGSDEEVRAHADLLGRMGETMAREAEALRGSRGKGAPGSRARGDAEG